MNIFSFMHVDYFNHQSQSLQFDLIPILYFHNYDTLSHDPISSELHLSIHIYYIQS